MSCNTDRARLLNSRQAAAYLGVSHEVVLGWLAIGRLQPTDPGHDEPRFQLHDLDALRNEAQEQASPDRDQSEPHSVRSPYLTSAEAARYLRLAGASSIRSLIQRGELQPDGRRGKRGPYLFLTATLDAWLRACLPPRRRRPPSTSSRRRPVTNPRPARRSRPSQRSGAYYRDRLSRALADHEP